ncbi:MAG TPA: hypothetical protein VMB46_06270 [Methanomassiliicoccales archaeon]|nr:hypothetical protein [Methanomassiliicoccales archaeon]
MAHLIDQPAENRPDAALLVRVAERFPSGHHDDDLMPVLASLGLVEQMSTGGYRIPKSPIAFENAFHIADGNGLGIEFLETPYAQAMINERLLRHITRDAFYRSVLAVLRILTDEEESAKNGGVEEVMDAAEQQDESYLSLMAIAGALDEVGFKDYLGFALGETRSAQERQERRIEALEEMAQRDVQMFFGPDPILPSAAECLESVLFPPAKRMDAIELLRTSPESLRMLLPMDLDEAPMPEAVVCLLPILEHLFTIFVRADLLRCNEESRMRADAEFRAATQAAIDERAGRCLVLEGLLAASPDEEGEGLSPEGASRPPGP